VAQKFRIAFLRILVTGASRGLCDSWATCPKPKKLGRQICPPHQAAKGPATPLHGPWCNLAAWWTGGYP